MRLFIKYHQAGTVQLRVVFSERQNDVHGLLIVVAFCKRRIFFLIPAVIEQLPFRIRRITCLHPVFKMWVITLLCKHRINKSRYIRCRLQHIGDSPRYIDRISIAVI